MTAIVAVVRDGRVCFGADSASTDEGGDYIGRLDEPKIWTRAGCIIGAAGSLYQLQRLKHCMDFGRYTRGSRESYLARRVVPAIREAIGHGTADFDLEILISVAGTIYSIDGSGAYFPTGDEWAIGSGGQVARGALYCLPKTLTPETRVKRALAAAAHTCASVDGPFVLLKSQ
jgi:ATP-dependent protease HslVU (ClpYQ) peptidase subunit